MSINRVIISGNVTRDPEVRRTQGGMTVLSFGVAVNDRRRNQQTGEWEDYANFVDCSLFGNRADSLANIIVKGMKLTIEGKLRWSQWETPEGQKRSKLEVIADEVELPPRNAQNAAQAAPTHQAGGYQYGGQAAPQMPPQQPQGGYQYGYGQQQAAAKPNASLYDQDIPF